MRTVAETLASVARDSEYVRMFFFTKNIELESKSSILWVWMTWNDLDLNWNFSSYFGGK